MLNHEELEQVIEDENDVDVEVSSDDVEELEDKADEIEAAEEQDAHIQKLAAMIRQSISEEHAAAADYLKRAAKCEKHGLDDVAKVFKDISDEEIVHVGEFQAVLKKYGLMNQELISDGEKEGEELLDQKVVEEAYVHKVTRDEWNKTHDDYKMIKNGKKYMMYIDPEHHKTVLGPVEIVDEEPVNEEFLDKGEIYSRRNRYKL